jgi:hypothetical protein
MQRPLEAGQAAGECFAAASAGVDPAGPSWSGGRCAVMRSSDDRDLEAEGRRLQCQRTRVTAHRSGTGGQSVTA